MKKNNMLRLASVLLVAVLLSTCAVSGVFAFYQSKDNTTDTARVAKWGVTVTGVKGTANDMFSDSYKDVATTWTENESTDAITVQAVAAGTNVVAPGTEGVLTAFDISGTPEVDVKVTYTPVVTLTGWEVDGTYCPLVITVNDDTFKIGDAGITYVSDLKTKVEAAIVAAGATYHTNADLTAVEDDLVVSWEWAFGAEDDTATIANDTALGNLATAPVFAIDVTATITQID